MGIQDISYITKLGPHGHLKLKDQVGNKFDVEAQTQSQLQYYSSKRQPNDQYSGEIQNADEKVLTGSYSYLKIFMNHKVQNQIVLVPKKYFTTGVWKREAPQSFSDSNI